MTPELRGRTETPDTPAGDPRPGSSRVALGGGPRRASAGLLALVLSAGAFGLGACTSQHSASLSLRPVSDGTTVPATTSTRPRPERARPKPKPRSKPTSTTSPGATVGTVVAPPPPVVGAVTMVGDSVGVDTQPYVEQDIPGAHVYAAVDRSWGEGETIIQSLASEHALGQVVVIELGLNGPISSSDVQAMMSMLSGVERVVLVNIRLPYGAYGAGTDWWQGQNNSVLAAGVRHYRNAVLADWYDYSAGHSGWFASDGIHLDSAGGAAMAELIRSKV